MRRPALMLAAAAALCGAPAVAAPDPVAHLAAACLDTFQAFAAAPAAFEAGGWAGDTGAADLSPARVFGVVVDGPGMVETGMQAASGLPATCGVLTGPQTQALLAADRMGAAISARSGQDTAPECFAMGVIGDCTWLWAMNGACRFAIATTAKERLTSPLARSFEAEPDCTGVSP